MLRNDLFSIAEKKYGPHTIDLMAARHNTQLPRYCNKDEDAFTLNWANENGWCNPPFHIIDSVLKHIIEQKATVTLCLPFWTKARWFKQWKDMVVDDPIILPNDPDTFLRRGKEVVTNTPWLYTMITRVSGDAQNHTPISAEFFIDVINNITSNINKYGYKKNDYIKSNLAEPPKICSCVCTSEQIPDSEPILYCRSITSEASTEKDLVNKLNLAPQDLEGSKLTEQQKLEIAISYHNLTHSYPDYVEETMRSTGRITWDDLSDIVIKADHLCLHCELNRVAKKGYHPLKSIRGRFAGDKWVIDLIPLPKQIEDTKFVLHILDVYSGFNILLPTREKSAIAIAEALYEVMCHHGYPQTIIHDCGSEFINTHVKSMLSILANMIVRGGAPYHPQTQGSNERRHSIIRNLIKEQLYRYSSNWKDALPSVMMKMNLQLTRKHNSTPFAVYYGRTHNAFATNGGSSEEWMQRLDKIEKHVHPYIDSLSTIYHDKMETAYNKKFRHRMTVYKIGDVVKMLNLNSQGTNLDNLYKGPYVIAERVGTKNYNLKDVNSATDTMVNKYPVPVEQLAEWQRSDIIQNIDNPTEVFKKILDHHITDTGATQYKVLWSDDSVTYEYALQFTDPSVLARYHDRVRKAKSAAQRRNRRRKKS